MALLFRLKMTMKTAMVLDHKLPLKSVFSLAIVDARDCAVTSWPKQHLSCIELFAAVEIVPESKQHVMRDSRNLFEHDRLKGDKHDRVLNVSRQYIYCWRSRTLEMLLIAGVDLEEQTDSVVYKQYLTAKKKQRHNGASAST
jgi:hypothetical protein